MKYNLNIALSFICVSLVLASCGSGTKTEDVQEEESPSAPVSETTEVDTPQLPTTNAYANKISKTVCETMSLDMVADIMKVTVSNIKTSFTDVGGSVDCRWGDYTSQDIAERINLGVSMPASNEKDTQAMWKSDLKNIDSPAIEAARVEIVTLRLDHETTATWNARQQTLVVYLSGDTFMRFHVGPATGNKKDQYKDMAIAFAQAYLAE